MFGLGSLGQFALGQLREAISSLLGRPGSSGSAEARGGYDEDAPRKKRKLKPAKKPAKKKKVAAPPADEAPPPPPLTEADFPPAEILPPLSAPLPPAWFYAMQQDAQDVADAMAFIAMLHGQAMQARQQDEQDMRDALRLLQQIPEQAAQDEARDLADIRALLEFA